MCKVDKCEDLSHCKGFCKRHYEQMRVHGKILHIENVRLKNRGKSCFVEGCSDEIRVDLWCNKHHLQRFHAMAKYGLTWEDKESLYKQQDCKCAICKNEVSLEKINVDHCHDTGKVRGLLCNQCNAGIGFFKDKPNLVLQAYGYLTASLA